MDKQELPPNAAKVLAICLKPARQRTRDDIRQILMLAANWTPQEHRAVAEFMDTRL